MPGLFYALFLLARKLVRSAWTELQITCLGKKKERERVRGWEWQRALTAVPGHAQRPISPSSPLPPYIHTHMHTLAEPLTAVRNSNKVQSNIRNVREQPQIASPSPHQPRLLCLPPLENANVENALWHNCICVRHCVCVCVCARVLVCVWGQLQNAFQIEKWNFNHFAEAGSRELTVF